MADDDETRQEARDRMEASRQQHNREVRNRETCIICGDRVPELDYACKYAAAAGVLSGPFCSRSCYWEYNE